MLGGRGGNSVEDSKRILLRKGPALEVTVQGTGKRREGRIETDLAASPEDVWWEGVGLRRKGGELEDFLVPLTTTRP